MEGAKPLCGHLRFISPGIPESKENLSREIGHFNLVGVDEPKPSKASCREVECHRAPQATNPNNGNA